MRARDLARQGARRRARWTDRLRGGIASARCRRLLGDRSGAIAVTTGLMATALLGITGLSVDVGSWYYTRRVMQSAADAAAIAGAIEQNNGSSNATITAAAKHDAGINGVGPAATVTVAISANPQSVTVTISQPATLLLSGIFFRSAPTIRVTGEAGLVNNGGPVCLLTLSPSASGALTINGNAQINTPGCSIVNDSTSNTALIANGNATIDSSKTCGPGGYSANGNVTLDPTPTKCPALADPLAGLTPPSNANSACQFNGLSFNGNVTKTLSPGVYCNGITINGNANITFSPGTYILRNGTFAVNGNANITANGVGFYLTGNGTTVDINGNGTVHMSAQTSGSMEGLLFAQDPAEAADSVTHSINGNGNVTYEGTFYFGKQDVDINGNGNANATAPFTMFIADKMTFNGNGTFNLNSNFQNSNVPPPKGMNLNRVTLLK